MKHGTTPSSNERALPFRHHWFPGRCAYLTLRRVPMCAAVFGLGMAGRVVVEGAPHPRGLLIEAYVPASSKT